MNSTKLKIHHFLFRSYYSRVPVFFHKWTVLKSISLLVQNYKHQESINEGHERVIRDAIKRERQMQSEISNLRLRLSGVNQETIDPVNKMFGTNLKGISREERDN